MNAKPNKALFEPKCVIFLITTTNERNHTPMHDAYGACYSEGGSVDVYKKWLGAINSNNCCCIYAKPQLRSDDDLYLQTPFKVRPHFV